MPIPLPHGPIFQKPPPDMPIKTGLPRSRSIVLDDHIAEDNPVRVIDAFVDSLDLTALGFRQTGTYTFGAPSYSAGVLLKIYLYGYFNRVRSSRRLEAECARNLELMWLTESLVPCYHTISTFRTYKKLASKEAPAYNHRKAMGAVFRALNQTLEKAELFGKELVAVDGTKIRAQNSKKNNISEEKINKKIEHHTNKFYGYLDEMDRTDEAVEAGRAPNVSRETINRALDEIQDRVEKLDALLDVLDEAQKTDPSLRQISLTDPEARAMASNNLGMVDIVYNVQSAVDDKHCLIAHFSVENAPDVHLLGKTSTDAKAALGAEALEVLADKGYHYGAELQKCADQNIVTYVAYPEQDYKTKEEGFQKEDFEYDAERDVYLCPVGEEMATTGALHDKKNRTGQLQNQYKLYRCPYKICAKCEFAQYCLTPSSYQYRQGRTIERSVFEDALVNNRLRVLNNRDKYKRRQAIVEHPFGTIKRSWGYYYTLLKGKEKVGAEYSLVFLTYNLRRAINILGAKDLINRLKTAVFPKTDACGAFGDILPRNPKIWGRKLGVGMGAYAGFGRAA